MWPPLYLQDRVRVRASGRIGDVNEIQPDADGAGWVFEVLFEESGETPSPRLAETVYYRDEELELIERSGFEHEPEIELDLKVSGAEPAVVAADALRVIAESLAVKAATYDVDGDRVRVQVRPHDHPREAVRRLMDHVGVSWLTEDDGWYANVSWNGRVFPIAGVDEAQLFLRPWRDPSFGPRLPGERAE